MWRAGPGDGGPLAPALSWLGSRLDGDAGVGAEFGISMDEWDQASQRADDPLAV